MAVKTRAVYRCGACGHQPAKWVGRCPECGEWGTVDEAAPASTSRSRGAVGVAPSSPAKRLTEIGSDAANLTKALKGDSKMQGDWGEMVLETILENSGL